MEDEDGNIHLRYSMYNTGGRNATATKRHEKDSTEATSTSKLIHIHRVCIVFSLLFAGS